MKNSIIAVVAFAAANLALAQEQAYTIADFTKPHKWGNPHHVANVASSEKGLSFAIDGEDPWFFGPAIEIPAVPAEPRRLSFTMTCAPTSRANSWQLFFAPSGRPFTEKMSCRLYPVGNPPYTRFATRGAVPFSLKGPCHFRLDPPPGSNETFTVKNLTMKWRKSLWSYAPQKVPPLVIPASTPLVLKDKGWELRHDPDRIGAFRFISRGKTVENLPEEPFVYVDKSGKVRTLDWANVKMTAVLDGGSLSTEAQAIDADGRRWWIRRHFMTDKKNDALVVLTRIEAETPKDSDEPAKALHVPALTLFVDRASNGHKHQAMLAGVEYLDDEPSSNTKEIRTHEHNRLIPAEYRLSAPMAVFTKEGSWFAALWMEIEKIKKAGAGPSQCAAVFDTPDRLFKSGGHLLAFWAPAVGPARGESELDVYEPVPLHKLEHLAMAFRHNASAARQDRPDGRARTARARLARFGHSRGREVQARHRRKLQPQPCRGRARPYAASCVRARPRTKGRQETCRTTSRCRCRGPCRRAEARRGLYECLTRATSRARTRGG